MGRCRVIKVNKLLYEVRFFMSFDGIGVLVMWSVSTVRYYNTMADKT